MVWDKDEVSYILVRMSHKQEVWIIQVVESLHHSVVCPIVNHFSESCLILAFQLKIVMAILTTEICHWFVCTIVMKMWASADRAEHILFNPLFRDHSHSLRITLVALA